MEATIVFGKIWGALNARNEDGSRKYHYIILEGSSRSSKTHSLLQALYLYSFKNRGKRATVWRETKKICKDTVLNDMLKAYRGFENYSRILYHRTESYFLFPTGSKIEIDGTDDEMKIHGYQGDVTWLNEPYKMGYETFNQLDMRTEEVVVIDWNPAKAHWIEKVKKDKKAITIHSTFKDNPFCPPKERDKILSYQPIRYSLAVQGGMMNEHDAREYDIQKNPKLLTAGQLKELARCIENERKQSASEFNWQVYGLGLKAEKPNRIFRWHEVPLHEYQALDVPKYGGVDWGAVDPMGVIEAKYYDGTLYLHELNYKSENEIKAGLGEIELDRIQRTEDEGIVKWLFERIGMDKDIPVICDNNRPNKVKALRNIGFDYAVACVKGKIEDGIDLLNSIRVCYTHTSENIAYEQENYSRKVDRYGIVLEEPEDVDNHTTDPARYIAEYLRAQGIINKV